jgi:hypothetical protein
MRWFLSEISIDKPFHSIVTNMHFSKLSILALSASLTTIFASPTPNDSPRTLSKTSLVYRNDSSALGEPETGDDLPPDEQPKPNRLNKVETAFRDAIDLTTFVGLFIATDTTIFPHYFDEQDRAEVARIFRTVNGGDDKGNPYLDKIFVQTTDTEGLCGGLTLAYSGDYNTERPFIVLCPNAFKKKAVSNLEGKQPSDPDGRSFYAGCREDGGDIDQNVSYVRGLCMIMSKLISHTAHEHTRNDTAARVSHHKCKGDLNPR